MKTIHLSGNPISKKAQKNISGGLVMEGNCSVRCTGCAPYECANDQCKEMKDESYVICGKFTMYCHGHPTCWSDKKPVSS